MATLSLILGIIGNVISILMFAAPLKTFKQVVKKKSTENFKGLPYITTLLSTSLWTFYGIIKPGGLLVATVNGAGAVIHIVYVAIFLAYAPKSVRVSSIKLVAALDVAFFGAVVAVTMAAFRPAIRLTVVGLICTGLTIGMYAAPLSAMRIVIRTKSVKYMPFLLSFFQFLNGGIWAAYAVLVADYFIGVPNGVGFLLGSVQLILYMIYRKKPGSEEQLQDDGSAHLYGGAIQMHGEEMIVKNRSLSKGNSLPKPSVVREYSDTLVKARSLSPFELENFGINDIERGLE
ncbi:bidirectional sugar transporter SWEET16-like isoform X1 [Andrographis paniculata]|uniref:bidirectional sugar transporter SWEET16-like isoform X1 n=1 Tax=Andrographis paniculata TaxID=175694 RepID=UPI0021E86D8A|nr:bidirectional sugar transporter SWEET16-like isoform X1 [Andrographis paniculata]